MIRLSTRFVVSASLATILSFGAFSSVSLAQQKIQKTFPTQQNQIGQVIERVQKLEARVTKLEQSLLSAIRKGEPKSQVIRESSFLNDDMDFDRTQFILLAIVIALAAYLGNIFIKVRETISTLKKEIGKRNIDLLDRYSENPKNEAIEILENEISLIDRDIRRHSGNLRYLLVADVFLIVLGFMDTLRILLREWFDLSFIAFDRTLVGLLALTIAYLALLHVFQWRQVWKQSRRELNHPERNSILSRISTS